MSDTKSSILFCLSCGSNQVFLEYFQDEKISAIICKSCHNYGTLQGFTTGVTEIIPSILLDAAKNRSYIKTTGVTKPEWNDEPFITMEKDLVKSVKAEMIKEIDTVLQHTKCKTHHVKCTFTLSDSIDVNILNLGVCCLKFKPIIADKIIQILKRYEVTHYTMFNDLKVEDQN